MAEVFTPRPFQSRFVEHAHRNPFAAIWADMGAGKTATVLTLLVRLFEELDVSKVLVVAPPRVASHVWPEEIAKWAQFQGLTHRELLAADFKLRRTPVEIKKRVKGDIPGTWVTRSMTVMRNVPTAPRESLLTNEQIHTISRDHFGTLVRFLKARDWPYDMLVIDEAQGFRNPDAGRFKAAKVLRKHRKIGRMVQLAGTPRPRSLQDIWAQLYLLDQGARLGATQKAYRDTFFTEGRKISGGRVIAWDTKPGAEEQIFERIGDLCVSLLPEDAVQLPERTINPVRVDLPPAALEQYAVLERDSLLLLGSAEVAAVNKGVLVGKLLQASGGAVFDDEGKVQVLHDAKLDALEEIIESHAGTPMLIACWYTHERDRIKARFPSIVELDDYPDTEARWNRGDIDLLLLHPGHGHGLNLQGNDGHGVWFGPIHDLELFQQWNKRLHRPGRKTPVFIHVLLAKGTIDSATLAVLNIKAEGQDRLLRATRMKLAPCSVEAVPEDTTSLIDEVIRIRREEIGL